MAKKSEEIKAFRKLLLERRAQIRGNVSQMGEQALKGTGQDFSVDHMADYGSDNYEQEFTLGLIENEQEVLREIDAALDRIEDGTFGDCEVCGKKIQKARLKAIPYARLCLECKKKEEERTST